MFVLFFVVVASRISSCWLYGNRFEKEAYHFLLNPFQNKLPSLPPLTIPWNGASVAISQESSIKDHDTANLEDSPVIIGTDEAPFHCSCAAGSSLVVEDEEEEEEKEEKQKRVSHTFSNKHGLLNAEQSPLLKKRKKRNSKKNSKQNKLIL